MQENICNMTALTVAPDPQERQRKARAVRRSLADITPSNSRSQGQSLFFSKLPAEIRFMVFQLLLSQTHDHERPINSHPLSSRPGHTYHTKAYTAILRSCRLVYYEAHSITIKSATHHPRVKFWGSIWLYHMTKQRGAEVYHLHDNPASLNQRDFTKFFIPHLHWKRVTWTIRAHFLWPPRLAGYREIDQLAEILASIRLPASCQEVNLEFDIVEDISEVQKSLQQQAELDEKIDILSSLDAHAGFGARDSAQQPVGLQRNDGTMLEFDDSYSKRYTWIGSVTGEPGYFTPGRTVPVKYRTIRLCWRAKVPRRDYMGYDHMDCLDLANCEEVQDIKNKSVDT